MGDPRTEQRDQGRGGSEFRGGGGGVSESSELVKSTGWDIKSYCPTPVVIGSLAA